MDAVIQAIMGALVGSSDGIFSSEEKKVLALGNIAQNNAIAVKRGRPIYASNLVKDIGSFERMGGGTDIISLILPVILKPVLENMMKSFNVTPPDEKVDTDAEAPAWANDIMDRLDKLEGASG